METKDAIRCGLDMNLYVLNSYLSDLTDEELMERPAPECNHLAWQLGHLISSEAGLLESVCPGKAAKLPDGFAEQHDKSKAADNDPSHFRTKAEYQELHAQVRAATLAALDELEDGALDGDAPEWLRETFPTVGHLFTLIGSHPMMHAGQFAVVRRRLGKPILM